MLPRDFKKHWFIHAVPDIGTVATWAETEDKALDILKRQYDTTQFVLVDILCFTKISMPDKVIYIGNDLKDMAIAFGLLDSLTILRKRKSI